LQINTMSEPAPSADEPAPPTETTPLSVTGGDTPKDEPLQDAAAGDAPAQTATNKTAQGVKEAASKAYAGAAVGAKVTADFTKKYATKVGDFVMDGPISFSVFAFAGGCAVMGAAIRDMVEEVIFTDPFQTLGSVFNLIFGIVIVLLESSVVVKKTPWRKTLFTQAAILKTMFGRGFFYLYLGLNLCATNMSVFSFWIGFYVLILGLIAIGVGWWTQRSLTRLRDALQDEELVVNSFHDMDKNNSGTLDIEEFAELCSNLGVPMNKVQLMAVFDVIDTSNSGVKKNTISLEEFQKWWSEWDDLAEVI